MTDSLKNSISEIADAKAELAADVADDLAPAFVQRLYWHSRRGMLELDLMLMPFVKECYPTLSEADRLAYRELLVCEDQDIFAWLMQRSVPDEPNIARIVDQVVSHARQTP